MSWFDDIQLMCSFDDIHVRGSESSGLSLPARDRNAVASGIYLPVSDKESLFQRQERKECARAR